jgi:hypothetical protein
MLSLKLEGRTLVIGERGGRTTAVHFDTKGEPVAVGVNVPERTTVEARFKAWKLQGKRSKWPGAKSLGRTDFWATLRSALRVSVGS